MGLIKFGGGVAGISGKIGGTVYARNRAGAYARNWAKPTNAPSPLQTANRTRFGTQAKGWQDLGQSDKDRWNNLALTVTRLNRLGDAYTPTGRQLYLESSNNLAVIGVAPLASAPLNLDAPSIVSDLTPILTITTGAITAARLTDGAATGGWTMVIETTRPFTSQKTNYSKDYRVTRTQATDAIQDFMDYYIAQFGDGDYTDMTTAIRASVIDESNGMRSPYLILFGVWK